MRNTPSAAIAAGSAAPPSVAAYERAVIAFGVSTFTPNARIA